MPPRSLVLIPVAAALALALAPAPRALQEDVDAPLRQKYLALTRGWAQQAVLTAAERQAMERGRPRERLMTDGLDDPLAREILSRGEPSFDALAAAYPGKVLDRTLLGSYSDPPAEAVAPSEEFVIWWNGAISANLVKGPSRTSPRIQALGNNTNILFRVGPDADMFGRMGDRYSRIGYEDGYLPIVQATYDRDGIRYRETAFADRHTPAGPGGDTAYVRFEFTNVSKVIRTAELHADVILLDGSPATASGGRVLDASGALLMTVSDAGASFDAAAQRLTHRVRLAPGATASVWITVPYVPDTGGSAAPPAVDCQQVYDRVRRFWARLASSGMTITVPEARVNNMWRALVLQNFVLADGPRFTYGSGLAYNDSTYPFENGFAALTMARYGHTDAAEAWLSHLIPASIDRQTAGWRYQNRRAIPLHLLYRKYLLTGSAAYFDTHRDELFRVADEIIADRHSTMTTTTGERPWHWGLLPPARPGVDARASTQETYVVAHDITNCQGLQDFGEFLVKSGIDRPRGERYLREAAEFRESLMRAMSASVIRSSGRRPFVPLETLYFRDTPDYGPEPYDNLALGRMQATYYHYWAQMELRYGFFNHGDPIGRLIADYLQHHGGFVLGSTRARPREGQPYGWINANYNAGYYELALAGGDVQRFLLGFYSRLAVDASRHVYVASEGAPFIGYNTQNGGFVGAEYSFPNSGANAETLDMLRTLLIREERDHNRPTGVIELAPAAPRAWFKDGARIEVRRGPTDFGVLSFAIESSARRGVISAEIDPPQRDPYRSLRLSLRHPQSRPIRRVLVNGQAHHDFDAANGHVTLHRGPAHFTVNAFYR